MKEEQLKRFANNEAMKQAVFDALLKFFIKPKPSSLVNEQAASFIAIGLLQDAWKDIERYKNFEDKSSGAVNNIGL